MYEARVKGEGCNLQVRARWRAPAPPAREDLTSPEDSRRSGAPPNL